MFQKQFDVAPHASFHEEWTSKVPSLKSTPITHTTSPIVTGTSVLAIRYKDGVMITADTLGSYGSLARFRELQRLIKVGSTTVIGGSGDISDLQQLEHDLESLTIDDFCVEDGHEYEAKNVHRYLSRVLYERRNKMNPFYNKLVVGGYKKGEKFLGYVDLLGTTYYDSVIATGYGAHIAIPLLRKAVVGKEDSLTEEQAVKLLDDCMRVLFYRDARSLNRLQRATINANGVQITEPYTLSTDWSFGADVKGYGA